MSQSHALLTRGLPLLALLTVASVVTAQEPMNGESATQPSPGQVLLKQRFHYYRFDNDNAPRSERGTIEDWHFPTALTIGVKHDVAVSVRVPTILRRQSVDARSETIDEEGVGDVTLLAKWRVWKNDTTALDTQRLSLLGGVDIRSGDDPFTTGAYSPLLGVAFTQIRGRHGLNASLVWKFTTGGNDAPVYPGESTADLLQYDAAYLYRIHPKQFSAEEIGGWYLVAGVSGYYETNGDHEILISPGFMYEGPRWVFEIAYQTPMWQDVEERAELDYVIMAGVRVTF